MTDIAKGSSIEYPTGSGIRIGTRINRVNGKLYNSSYIVRVPTKLTGKQRLRKTFPTLEKAKAFAGNQQRLANRHGQAAFKMTEEQRVDAVRALEMLKGTSLTLEAVTGYALPRLQPCNGQVTVQEVADKIIEARTGMNLRPRTEKDFRNRLNKFCETFGDANILEIELNGQDYENRAA